jgi:hypothetical protein
MARYFAKIEIVRKQPGTGGVEHRVLAPLSRGDSFAYHKDTNRLTYVVGTAEKVVWDFSIQLCTLVRKAEDGEGERFVPGTLALCYTNPDTIERMRSYLVLALSGHVGGLVEEDHGEIVVWTIS